MQRLQQGQQQAFRDHSRAMAAQGQSSCLSYIASCRLRAGSQGNNHKGCWTSWLPPLNSTQTLWTAPKHSSTLPSCQLTVSWPSGKGSSSAIGTFIKIRPCHDAARSALLVLAVKWLTEAGKKLILSSSQKIVVCLWKNWSFRGAVEAETLNYVMKSFVFFYLVCKILQNCFYLGLKLLCRKTRVKFIGDFHLQDSQCLETCRPLPHCVHDATARAGPKQGISLGLGAQPLKKQHKGGIGNTPYPMTTYIRLPNDHKMGPKFQYTLVI